MSQIVRKIIMIWILKNFDTNTTYGNSKHVALAWKKIGLFGEKNPICDCSLSNQMPLKDRITDIVPYLRTLFMSYHLLYYMSKE